MAVLFLLLLALLSVAAADDTRIAVSFFGEAQCPFCREFVKVWDTVWQDKELKAHVDYTFVPWGNAYFGTEACGSGPYNPQERACWYDHCIVTTHDDEQACFGGAVVYQHSEKEGQIDIYESCVLETMGLEAAVAFTFCCEGPNMDNDSLSAQELMELCLSDDGDDSVVIQQCLETKGHAMEVSNAKKTPVHPGVPYILVDGEPLENPLEVKAAICKILGDRGETPAACDEVSKEEYPRNAFMLA